VETERLMGWPDGWTIVPNWQPRSTRAAMTAASEPSLTSISSEELPMDLTLTYSPAGWTVTATDAAETAS
jgi:hypothetical protein